MFDLGVLSALGERRNLAIRQVRQVGQDLRIIARMG
jgi:hypothetical protein